MSAAAILLYPQPFILCCKPRAPGQLWQTLQKLYKKKILGKYNGQDELRPEDTGHGQGILKLLLKKYIRMELVF